MLRPYANLIATTFTDALLSAINGAASSDPSLREMLDEIEDRTFVFKLTDMNYEFCLHVQDGIVSVADTWSGEADVMIHGTMASFVKALTSGNMNPTQMEGIELFGDMKLAQRLYNMIGNLDFDWEEEIAKRAGDVPARHLGNLLRWGKRNLVGNQSVLASKIRSTLVEQNHIVPPRSRVEKFLDDVDTLQADLDRLEKRAERLEK